MAPYSRKLFEVVITNIILESAYLSVSIKKKDKYWFMLKLKKLLKHGYLRIRKDGVSELVITGVGPVEQVLLQLKDSLVLKKKNANLVLKIIEKKRKVNSKDEFIEVCKLVDQVAELNYSKTRLVTSKTVINSLIG